MDHFEMIEKVRDDFANKIWPLNKSGNPELGLSAVASAIRTTTDVYGKPITIELIIKKYKEYISYMKEINAGREPKYYSRVSNIAEFVNNRLYNSDFKLPSSQEVDEYLYGY